MPIYAGKNLQYAHFAEICKKNAATCKICGNHIFVYNWHA